MNQISGTKFLFAEAVTFLSLVGSVVIFLALYFYLFIGGPSQNSLYPMLGELMGFVLVFVLLAFALAGFFSGLLIMIVVFRAFMTRREAEGYFARIPGYPKSNPVIHLGIDYGLETLLERVTKRPNLRLVNMLWRESEA